MATKRAMCVVSHSNRQECSDRLRAYRGVLALKVEFIAPSEARRVQILHQYSE